MQNANNNSHSGSSDRHNWTEFDWEMSMRKGDEFVANYFNLFDQYNDLPEAQHIIYNKLIGDDDYLPDSEFYLDDDNTHYEEIEEQLMSGMFHYERQVVFASVRHIAIGWCNIYALYILPEERKKGLLILYHLGRCLTLLVTSLGEEKKPSDISLYIAAGKRAAGQINTTLGLLNEIGTKNANYIMITNSIRESLSQVHDQLVDHIFSLKKK